MNPLIIDNNVREKIRAVKEHAEKPENEYTLERIRSVIALHRKRELESSGSVDDHYEELAELRDQIAAAPGADAPGNLDGFHTVVPMGFRVVYSVEQQPAGRMRHMSISSVSGLLPTVQIVEAIMKEFGFSAGSVHDLDSVYVEEETERNNANINLLEFLG